jgi:hypothetical protein
MSVSIRYALLAMIICVTGLQAQPVINVGDIPTEPGTTIHYSWTSSAVTVNAGPSGPNQVWNFSLMPTDYDYPENWILPSQTPFVPVFPTANRVADYPGGAGIDNYTFFNVTPSSATILGTAFVTPNMSDTIIYDGGNTIYNFPISYGDEWDTAFNFPSFFPDYLTRDSVHYVVDGWGTVIDITGSFPCLRVQSHAIITTYYLGNPISTSSSWSYTWVVAGRGSQVYIASLGNESNPNFTTGQFGRLTDVTAVRSLPTPLVMPTTLELNSGYPNPFNASTMLSFTLPQPGDVSLVVFDAAGRQVSRLIQGYYQPGAYQVSFDGAALSSGVYLARLTSNGFQIGRNLTLLK